MTNLASALKEEIRRLARKEIKAQTGTTAQAVARYRREIARLKRQVRDQEKKVSFLEAQERKRLGQTDVSDPVPQGARFSARSVKAQRERLGLSCRLRQARGGLAADDLQLGALQVSSRKEQLASLVGTSWHRQAGSAGEVGAVASRQSAGVT